ncbi:MAG: alkyl hydroperoxide reductase [Caldilineaceae bacterium]
MRQLRQVYPNELVIIGVHSAKFPTEKLTENIREAVMRHDIRHPVVNDADFEIWSQYGVRAWPTVVLVDPMGKVVGYQSGEIDADEFTHVIEAMAQDFRQQHALKTEPLAFQPEIAGEPARTLLYPSKVLAVDSQRLFVADTGHHRILELQLDEDGHSATIARIIGSSEAGLRDGPLAEAQFHDPHGMALIGDTLFVADTENHAIRAVDLATGAVRTVAGTGQKGRGLNAVGGAPREVALRSPWALAAVDDILLIAMAGSHQIWLLTFEAGEPKALALFAGAGAEALIDGPRDEAAFNQPSDLVFDMGHLFVADSEASAIRAISLDSDPQVMTLVGQGLFEFGDVDGVGADVRLQHPTGLTTYNGLLYIADSYNHKIKTLDPTSGATHTLIGTGEPGVEDGPFGQASLYEPEGLAVVDGRLYIADTNNHIIRVTDLKTRELFTLYLLTT